MAETHVISALVTKRSELAGLVDHHKKEIVRLSQDVKLLDATIRLFESEFSADLIKPKRHTIRKTFSLSMAKAAGLSLIFLGKRGSR